MMRYGVAFAALILFLPCLAQAQQGATFMVASWYQSGRIMADGHQFDAENPHIAANRTLPLHTVLKVTNPKNGKTIRVTVQDRGPYVKGRSLDLSRAAAKKLGYLKKGVAKLKVVVLHRPPIKKKKK